MSNTITAYFKGRIGVAEAVYQNDYGIVMAFDSIDLPAHFECFFSKLNQEEAVPGLGADSRVAIPNSVLADPGNVTIHIPLHTGEDDSEVEYVVYFKVIGRARPIDDGTPTQMTAIERALALLSQPITNIEEIVNEALSFTGDTFAEMKQELADDFAEYKGDVDDDIADFKTEIRGDIADDIADFKTEIRGDIADVEHDFDILDGQFQTAVAAITVDSEVQGIRTGDDGVTYTSAGVAVRKQISDVKSDFINCFDKSLGKNRVNSAEIENGYLNSSGALVQHSDWKSTGLCDVRGFSNIVASGSRVGESPTARYAVSLFFLCTYDSGKNFIEQINIGSATTWAVTSGVAYVRFSIHSDEIENIMLESGATPTTLYEPYVINYELKDDCIADVINEVDELSNKFGIAYSTNRNPDNDTVGYLKSDGTIGSAGDWKTTDFCYVADLESVIGSSSKVGESEASRYALGLHFLCSYDSDKNFIEQIYTSGQTTWTVASGTAYVRFSYHSDEDENVMIASDPYIAPFVDYYKKIMLKPQYYDRSGDSKWIGKKWTVVGDSLTEANSRTNAHYYDYISEATGITVNVMGASGTGYARGQSENKAFYQRISSVPTDSDVVTIFGSFNDMGSGLNLGTATDSGTTTIGGCINTTIDNLFTAYPLAQVGIVTPPPWIDANPLTEPNSASAYVSLIKEICSRRSIPCLDMFHESLLRPWESSFRALAYSKDDGNGVHPDETGHKIMAPRFKAFLESLLI